MSVNPGNVGQMYRAYVGEKYKKLLSIKMDMDFEVYWDAACTLDRIQKFAPWELRASCLVQAFCLVREDLTVRC